MTKERLRELRLVWIAACEMYYGKLGSYKKFDHDDASPEARLQWWLEGETLRLDMERARAEYEAAAVAWARAHPQHE